MDLIIDPQKGKGKGFVVEVGFFDTVLEIKQKIQKYQNIPVSDQTLVFDKQTLTDDKDVRYYDLLHNSRLTLLSKSATTIAVTVRIPSSSPRAIALEINPDETIQRLKEKVAKELAEGFGSGRVFGLSFKGAELAEAHRTLRECGVGDGDEVEASFLGGPGGGRRAAAAAMVMRVTVVGKCGTKKVTVDVSASDNVGELRKELQRVSHGEFGLPSDGYFFIHKQNVMDDNRSFRWHGVSPGDTIEIFNGTVSGGGS